MPRWKPPRTPTPGACSDDQIQRRYAACEGPLFTAASCTAFRNDSRNASCNACLVANESDSVHGAIIYVGDSWKTNTPGCIALVDGDRSATGCGSRAQAASDCYDAACDGCQPFESYLRCRQQAIDAVCRPYYLDAVCFLRPAYSTCTSYANNEEFFVGTARFFCGPMRAGGEGDR